MYGRDFQHSIKSATSLLACLLQMDLEHQREMRSNARALVERRGSEGGGGQRITQAARIVTAFMENSFPNFLEGGTTVPFSLGGTLNSKGAFV